MASLYEINSELEQAINAMFAEATESETGEVSQETADRISELQMQKDEKLDNIGAYIKNLDAEAKALKAEADALTERMKSTQKKIESLKNYVASILNGEKFESPRVVFSFRNSESVVIPDLESLSPEFVKEKVERSADKTAIKEALKAGKEVRGAFLETKSNLQIK